MTLKETLASIIDKLSDHDKECMMDGCFMYGDNIQEFFDAALINIKQVDSYGGEDMGSDYWAVYSFGKDNEKVFVKFYGWYASHVGSEYRGYVFVEPKEKTITVYE